MLVPEVLLEGHASLLGSGHNKKAAEEKVEEVKVRDDRII